MLGDGRMSLASACELQDQTFWLPDEERYPLNASGQPCKFVPTAHLPRQRTPYTIITIIAGAVSSGLVVCMAMFLPWHGAAAQVRKHLGLQLV